MKAVISVAREVAGLFVDDGALALAILGVVVIAALLSQLVRDVASIAGAVLLFGCLGVLFVNVTAAGTRRR